MVKLKHEIVFAPDKQTDIWFVNGGRWEGRVMRPKHSQRFSCDCLQYAKYHTCWHIRAVKDELFEKHRYLTR